MKSLITLLASLILLSSGNSAHFSPTLKRAKELPAGFVYASNAVCNNDRIKEGYGCVTGELKDYGFDTEVYHQNLFDSKVLLTADSDDTVYLYLYKNEATEVYDSVTLSSSTLTSDGVDYSEDWNDYKLNLVSYSENGALEKYEILDLVPSSRYAVAKVFNYDTRNDINTILTVSFEYLSAVDPDNHSKKITTIKQLKSIKVLDTFNAFQLMRIGASDSWNQMHYAAFNLDTAIDSIQKVELQYYSRGYICDTTITDTVGDAKEDRFTYGFDKSKCKDINYTGSKDHFKVTISPEKKEIITHGFAFARRKYIWNTLAPTADYNEKLINSEIKNKYKWLVNFANNEIYAPRRHHGLTGYYDLTDSNRPAVEITDLNFLQFWYTHYGEERTAIAVDRYTDSNGNVPVIEGKNYLAGLTAFFDQLISFFKLYGPFIALALGALIGLWFLSKLISILKTIFGRKQ